MAEQPVFAFVLMPFRSEFSDVYKLGIKEAAAKVGIAAERLDEQLFSEGMLDRIYRQIEVADIIIADMTGQNPNVFYEVGYAHAKGKLCILLTKDAKDIPFDLQHRRHIEYKGSISLLREELEKHLAWAKTEVENAKLSKLRIEFKEPNGTLKNTKFASNATVEFKLNVFNDLIAPYAEINAIHLYTGREWTVKQDNKECPSVESDIPDYKFRYFLTPPVSRLPKGSGAQLQFTTSKRLANKMDGDSIQDYYRLTGHILLRFITTNGTFDHTYDVDVTVVDIPF